MVERPNTNWATDCVPSLLDDGSNFYVWKIVVQVVAHQHGAQDLLSREPTNEPESVLAHNLKQFILETCGSSNQSLIQPLSALRAWRYIQIAAAEPISPQFSPGVKHVPSNVSVTRAFSVELDTASADSGRLPRITQDTGYHGRIKMASTLEPPEDYPVRDDNLIWEDIDRTLKGKEESDDNPLAGILTRSKSAPGKLQLSKNDSITPDVPISPFKASSGRRRALLIGINYSGNAELRGCVRDQVFLAHLLRSRFGFKSEEMHMLTDEPHGLVGILSGKPTMANIVEAMAWLMRDARQGDSLFFSFSGHGGQTRDMNGDERGGFDDTICPVDFQESGDITDDELYELLVKRVPKGARLTAVIDSCHSGTVLDLPYSYDVNKGIRYDERTVLEEVEEEEEEEEEAPSKLNRLLRKLRLKREKKEEKQQSPVYSSDEDGSMCSQPAEYSPRADSKGGEVLLFSGCQDGTFSTESQISKKGAGLMTYSFVYAIERGLYKDWHNYTYGSLMKAIQDKVTAWQDGQHPQFSSSHPFNLDSPFLL